MIGLLRVALKTIEAPAEQFERLGVGDAVRKSGLLLQLRRSAAYVLSRLGSAEARS
jgi:hypothetical protein